MTHLGKNIVETVPFNSHEFTWFLEFLNTDSKIDAILSAVSLSPSQILFHDIGAGQCALMDIKKVPLSEETVKVLCDRVSEAANG